ncbi:MAG: hypothetical protein LBT23_02435 [Synergistaceae bacterium]|nr:hypothetical protein [Synergistaceae bacterium]
MLESCPGAIGVKGAPTIKIKVCPECGKNIEIFSNITKNPCTNCGFIVYNDSMSCVKWCRYAKECVGEELYNQITGIGE